MCSWGKTQLTKACVELRVLRSSCVGRGDEGSGSVVERHVGEAEREPESTEGAEYHEGEGVADDPL